MNHVCSEHKGHCMIYIIFLYVTVVNKALCDVVSGFGVRTELLFFTLFWVYEQHILQTHTHFSGFIMTEETVV